MTTKKPTDTQKSRISFDGEDLITATERETLLAFYQMNMQRWFWERLAKDRGETDKDRAIFAAADSVLAERAPEALRIEAKIDRIKAERGLPPRDSQVGVRLEVDLPPARTRRRRSAKAK